MMTTIITVRAHLKKPWARSMRRAFICGGIFGEVSKTIQASPRRQGYQPDREHARVYLKTQSFYVIWSEVRSEIPSSLVLSREDYN